MDEVEKSTTSKANKVRGSLRKVGEMEEYAEGQEEPMDPSEMIRTMMPAEIDKLIPKRKFDQLQTEFPEIGEGTCTICIDFLKNGEMLRVIPICQHVFHAECLLNWLQVNEICPNCKNEVNIYTLRAYFDSLKMKREKSLPNKIAGAGPAKDGQQSSTQVVISPRANQAPPGLTQFQSLAQLPVTRSIEVTHSKLQPAQVPAATNIMSTERPVPEHAEPGPTRIVIQESADKGLNEIEEEVIFDSPGNPDAHSHPSKLPKEPDNQPEPV